jgi:hypothetical protein
MNQNDDFLSDLESDIDGDWEEIQKKIKDKEYEEHLNNNPQRFFYPKFKDFYRVLVGFFRSWDGQSDNTMFHDLHMMLRHVFYYKDDHPMPRSFDRIWEMFCNPREFACKTEINCKQCSKVYDIFYKNNNIKIDRFSGVLEQQELQYISINVLCPSCGYHMQSIVGGELFGIFKHEHNYENMGERGNESKF